MVVVVNNDIILRKWPNILKFSNYKIQKFFFQKLKKSLKRLD